MISNRKALGVLCCLVAFQSFVFAQTKNRVLSIPVERNGIQLRNPWVGGMNTPQFSAGDLNNDGFKDLVIFDRTGNKVVTYLNRGNNSDTTFYYAPQYEGLFPAELNNWVLLRDYNLDGVPDLFTYQSTSIKVYKGKYVNNQLHFDLVKDELKYDEPPISPGIWSGFDDIPVITDVNGDGDIDVLTYGTFGARIEYYENQTKENAGNPAYAVDSLKYRNVTICWGNFTEGANNSISLGVTCKGDGLNEVESDDSRDGGARDGAHSIFELDKDNDGDVDILMGNLNYYKMFLLENCGDSISANICSYDSTFPACNVPVNMPSGPSGYGIDYDNDGDEDLVIAPNSRTSARDVKNVMVYKNVSNPLCNYEYQTDSFLVKDMLDFGTDSRALFFDFTGDGLQDIVVSNYGYFQNFAPYKSTIAVYENTGTATAPRFRMLTEDYNNFGNLLPLVGMYAAFGDLDGDGKADMLSGDQNGYLHFFKNSGSTGASFPSLTTQQYFNIDAGDHSAPCIFDVNGDGLKDIVVGRRDGRLNYYRNFGTVNSPLFHNDSVITQFGGINVAQAGQSYGFSTPFLIKESNDLMLYIGSNSGRTFKYLVNVGNLNGTFQLLDPDFLKYNVGYKSTISVADINSDGFMEYLCGNSRGGLLLYSDSVWDPGLGSLGFEDVQGNLALRVFPNPANQYVTCSAPNQLSNPAVDVFNMVGEKMYVTHTTEANNIRINTAHLSTGIYFVRITDEEKTYSAKMLISK